MHTNPIVQLFRGHYTSNMIAAVEGSGVDVMLPETSEDSGVFGLQIQDVMYDGSNAVLDIV